MEDPPESIYHIVKITMNKEKKTVSSIAYHKSPMDLLYPSFGVQRGPPLRYPITRLREWGPNLDELLIVGGSNAIDFSLITKSSAPLSSEQQVTNDYAVTTIALDGRKATLPEVVKEEEGGDSILIGEALDLSSKDKVPSPLPMDEEYPESPGPLPAFLALNHQGLLSAWWIVYDNSIREGVIYRGFSEIASAQSTNTGSNTTPKATQQTPTTSLFNAPKATFGTPGSATFGQAGFSNGNSNLSKTSPPKFGQASSPAFGQTSSTTFGQTSTFGKPQPAFGAASSIGGFGGSGTMGKPSSIWGSGSQSSTSQSQSNPFASQAGNSGFAKLAGPNNTTANSGSGFGALGGTSSPFSALGGQKSGLLGNKAEPPKLSSQPSIGSTVTVGSSFGDGSTLPSWSNTPAQKGNFSFNSQKTPSFESSKESDMSDADDAPNRQRDEATPTPQPPPQQPTNPFGLPANGFKLGSTFKPDGTAKDDLPKPAASSGGFSFDSDFGTALSGLGPKPPATPIKKEEEEPRLQDISTTPASPPKPPVSTLFPSATPAKAPPAATEKFSVPEDAPLPPDPMTYKPPKTADDDLPPIAGSPAIKVEAPDSDVPSSPLEDDDNTDEDDDISVEEHDGNDEDEESSPSDAARRSSSRPEKKGWSFQDSVNQSPQIRPAAPTPPTIKSGPSSQSGGPSRGTSRSPAPQPIFGQPSKAQAPQSMFGQGSKPPASSLFQPPPSQTAFSQQPPKFEPPANRAQNLRSPSPVRSASTSALNARRQQVFPTGSSLSSSIQQTPKPPTPQPELSDLSDDEDERIRELLTGEIVPSRTLESFIAHQDYTGAVTKTGTAAQIEIMYRDMNSMVDTLGLNSRSLASFLAYHSERNEITREHLDEAFEQGEDGPWVDEWRIAEIESLKALENELEDELDEGRVENVLDKLSQLARLLHEKARLLTKLNDIRRQIINRKDPEKQESLRKASLPKELAEQQKALRNEYARLLSHISQAEEAAFLLKSKVASSNAVNGKTGAVPTVDAVKKTINSLIRMTEKKNNDILLLESQLRKLNVEGSRPTSSSSRTMGTPLRSSRFARTQSPLATPPTNKSKMSLSELNRTVQTPEPDETPSKGYGLYYTPEGSPTQNGFGSLIRLANEMDTVDMNALRETNQRRKKVASALTTTIQKRGVKVTKVSK
jgi:nucleoporin NUP159